jgi:hypothetical protein
VLAGRILAWRAQHGRFSRVEELGEVSGIGDKLLAELAPAGPGVSAGGAPGPQIHDVRLMPAAALSWSLRGWPRSGPLGPSARPGACARPRPQGALIVVRSPPGACRRRRWRSR